MQTHRDSVFRADALRFFRDQQEETVVPRWVAPRTLWSVWLLVVLLSVALGFAWWVRVPTFVAGQAVVDGNAVGSGLVILLPAAAEGELRTPFRVWVALGGKQARVPVWVEHGRPERLAPLHVMARYGLCGIDQPMVAVRAVLPDDLAPLPVDRVFRVHLETETKRLWHMLPRMVAGAPAKG